MTQNGYLILTVVVVLSTAFILYLLRHKLVKRTAKDDPEQFKVEIARLTERNSSLTEEATRYRTQISGWEAKDRESQREISVARDERSRLGERASRVEPLEEQLREARSQINSLQENNTITETQLTERTQSLELLKKRTPELEQSLLEATRDASALRENLATITTTSSHAQADVEKLKAELSDNKSKYEQLLGEHQKSIRELAEATTTLNEERTNNAEKITLLIEAKEQLAAQFKALANDILEEKSKRFTDQNKQNLKQILDPLQDKLQTFQSKVEQVYIDEGKDRTALKEQVSQLVALNQQLSADAENLTQALKGSSKARGTWGEMVLERILETAGLRKGHEYEAKESHVREDGTRGQPDVVIHLPEDKHLVIDAKVSLTAYDEYVRANDDVGRKPAASRHIASVRGHVKDLSRKNYQELYGLRSLDFVIMFVPIESAFILAISEDPRLWEDAWKQNVLLISPSALLFVLRTVAHLWRQEQRNQNVKEIAKRGAELCDKLSGFLEDMDDLGNRLTQARDAYDGALNKFTRGRGNLIWQSKRLTDLGIKPTKPLPHVFIESSSEEELDLPADEGETSPN